MSSFELIIQDNNTIYKIIPTIFPRYAGTCYYNLGPNSIPSFSDLYSKLLHILA